MRDPVSKSKVEINQEKKMSDIDFWPLHTYLHTYTYNYRHTHTHRAHISMYIYHT